MGDSSAVWLQGDQLLFLAACVSHCWSLCLCVCVLLEGRATRRRAGGGGMRLGSSSWSWQLSRAMRLALRWCRLRKAGRGGGRLSELWSYSKLVLRSLFSNSLSDSDTLLDCAFEPVYWIVDNVTRWFGVVSPPFLLVSVPRTFLLVLLTSSSPPPGVCVPSGPTDVLCGDHRLPVCPADHLNHLPGALDRLASLLRPLAPPAGGLPLLQGHHHLPWTPP